LCLRLSPCAPEFKKEAPEWELVLDIDALAAEEGKSWVWKGTSFVNYGPGHEKRKDRCVVSLSDGGTDACTRREFDVTTKAWITAAEQAFVVPESKAGPSPDAARHVIHTRPNTRFLS